MNFLVNIQSCKLIYRISIWYLSFLRKLYTTKCSRFTWFNEILKFNSNLEDEKIEEIEKRSNMKANF